MSDRHAVDIPGRCRTAGGMRSITVAENRRDCRLFGAGSANRLRCFAGLCPRDDPGNDRRQGYSPAGAYIAAPAFVRDLTVATCVTGSFEVAGLKVTEPRNIAQ